MQYLGLGSVRKKMKCRINKKLPLKVKLNNGQTVEAEDTCDLNEQIPTYIGESSRLMRTRTFEHMTALEKLNKKSFQVQHWMTDHGTSPFPPRFKFRVIGNFKDPLSRQLCEALEIMRTGNLNQKTEFKINDLCRLVTDSTEKEKEVEVATAKIERDTLDLQLDSFVNVMKNVINKEIARQGPSTNPHNIFRQKAKRRGEEESDPTEREGNKRKREWIAPPPLPSFSITGSRRNQAQTSSLQFRGRIAPYKWIQKFLSMIYLVLKNQPEQERKRKYQMILIIWG